LQRLEAVCRRQRIPITVQRRVIFTALLECDDHPTADRVFARVRDRVPGLSRTTVYRTLETLAKLGLIRRTNHFAASARFDANMERHHHLVCTACGKVVDFQDASLRIPHLPNVRENGFTLLEYSVYFEGHCSDCVRRTAKPAAPKQQKPTSGLRGKSKK
jgi:Fur family peroxide stress response transcriptional regulator